MTATSVPHTPPTKTRTLARREGLDSVQLSAPGAAPLFRYMSNAMSVKRDIRAYNRQVEHACRTHLGVGIVTWRSFKYVFYITTLGLTLYLLEYQDVEPVLAMVFSAVLISGPDILEWWLVREDYVDYEEVKRPDD